MLLVGLLVSVPANAAGGVRGVISANGVRLTRPPGWHRVPATPSSIIDPRTLLVVGRAGVRPDLRSQCQIAAYRVPARGAVVVIVGWKTATSGGGHLRPGRAPLKALVSVRRPSFECYGGRGAAADLALGGRAYQVNVMVGDRASRELIAEALAVARSFDLIR